MKKRIITAALACLFLIMSAVSVFAGSVTYYSEKDGFSIEIPDSFLTIRRDMTPDDPTFEKISLTYEDVMEIFASNDNYLEASSPSGTIYMTVSVYDSGMNDFSEFSDDEIEVYAEATLGNSADNFINYSYYEKYAHPQTRFVMFRGFADSTREYVECFDTVYDGKEILVALFTKEPVSSYLDGMVKDVVDSIVFNEKTDKGGAPVNKSWLFLIIATVAVVPVAVVMVFSHKKANANAEDVPPHFDPDGGGTDQ